jgi:hypothetical protein
MANIINRNTINTIPSPEIKHKLKRAELKLVDQASFILVGGASYTDSVYTGQTHHAVNDITTPCRLTLTAGLSRGRQRTGTRLLGELVVLLVAVWRH